MNMAEPFKVHHKEYGDGEVIKTTEEKIYVKFSGKQMIFPYPEALDKGYLTAYEVPEKKGEGSPDGSEFLLPDEIKHQIIVIKISQRYENRMNPDDLYNSVRGIWKASKDRAEKADYVFGVYQSVIVAVYKPSRWYVCKDAKDMLPREDIVLSAKNEKRIFFVDQSFEQGLPLDDNQEFYLGKSIAKLTMNKNSQNPITYLDPKALISATAGEDPNREVTLDAADHISYNAIYEALNATVGTNYSGWMKATWPRVYTSLPFRIWFPKLAETKNGKKLSAAFDCVNTISNDWNEVIFDDLKNGYVEGGEQYTGVTLIFAKEPKGGPYIYRGVYIDDAEKSRPNHYVSKRIGTKVKLVGQPSESIEILDDFRN